MADEIIIVTGHQARQVERAVDAAGNGRAIRFVHCHDYAAGLSASLRAGLGASRGSAALICLGDMPLVTAPLLDQIIAAYDQEHGQTIVAPTYQARLGNPVLWDRRYFSEIADLKGDRGARALLDAYANEVHTVEVGTPAVLIDFDTPERWAQEQL